jgi:hypothetical protein
MVKKREVPDPRARWRLRFSTGYFITECCRWRSGVNGRLLVVGLGGPPTTLPYISRVECPSPPTPRQIPEMGIFEGKIPEGSRAP